MVGIQTVHDTSYVSLNHCIGLKGGKEKKNLSSSFLVSDSTNYERYMFVYAHNNFQAGASILFAKNYDCVLLC